jgi:hypothetical protein
VGWFLLTVSSSIFLFNKKKVLDGGIE